MVRRYLYAAIAVIAGVASAASLQAQEGKSRKFLKKPLVIEDQGSFFIGGVPKVTNYATVPANAAEPGELTPNQITIGQMYVQFQIPANKKAQHAAGDHGARLDAHGGVPGIDAGRPRRLVIPISCATGSPLTSSIRRDADARGSTNPSFMKRAAMIRNGDVAERSGD